MSPAAAEIRQRPFPATSSAPPLRLSGTLLEVPPFRLELLGQVFVNDVQLEIDLSLVDEGVYRILVVHNFHVEDRNPNLDECIGGVFLARRRRDGSWEEPERFPVECRALALLGVIEVADGSIALSD
jgi:hypothetical protein